MARKSIRIPLVILVVLLVACSGYKTARQAEQAETRGEWDEAVLQYMDLVDRFPDNVAYRTGLLRAKMKASQMHFERGKDYYEAGTLELALREYTQAVQLDRSNQYAAVELEKVAEELSAAREGLEPTPTLEEMKTRTRGARAQP
ncbi:MAG: hypothetical protein EP299_04990, partial [Acidobacteria bacterium]